MDIKNLAILTSAVINLFLGISVYLKGRDKITNKAYSMIALSVFYWCVGMMLYRSATSPEESLAWCRVLYTAPVLIVISFLYFSYIFPQGRINKIIGALIVSSGLVFICLSLFTDLIIKNIEFVARREKTINFGDLYFIFYQTFITGFFIWAYIILIKKWRASLGIVRAQIIYVFLGTFLASGLAMVTNMLLPSFGIFVLNWAGQILSLIMVGFIAYAIIRYRLMDIRIVARRIFVYIGTGAFTYGIFYLVIWIYGRIFGGLFSAASYAAGLIIAPIFVFLFYKLDRGLRVFANRFLFTSLYNYQETINKLTNDLNNYIDLDKIINLIVDTIKKTMRLNRAGVLLVNTGTNPVSYKIAKVIGFNRKNGISLVQDNFLTRYLEKTQKPLVRDELALLIRDAKNSEDRKSFLHLSEHMRRIEAFLCLPLMSNKKLIGIIVLGVKLSGDAYTSEDLELLNVLSKQAGVAIENARLYKEVREFNQTLQGKVNEQTKNIQVKKEELERKTLELEEKNKYLKELLEMRSDFLNTASHQLKTPVSVIKGMLSMIMEGGLEKEKVDQFVKSSYEKAIKLSEVINDILRASESESAKMNLNLTKTDIKTFLEKIIEDKKILAEKKGLTFKLSAPKKISPVTIDEKYMSEAIGNLVDNSIKYTVKGGVFIKLEEKHRQVYIRVCDTGIGIPEDDEPKLFDKFVRAKNAVAAYTDGTGLGLFIVKKIVNLHEGAEIKIEWTEEGKGTTFLITLPIMS